ncbi:class III extradiol ring-cleavage dioxygenase [Pusillimonas sp. SM2304]|uniref:DODA-type extradiol aromatic ring-opening family dioxygenase n=1 Tax=Pusillimonas sp. SM2304 TaxID=3073241 RepID=UPI002875D9EC|nr:class III extradiol ring-cleavage dioxygenase [Pusillimonas sp. SM2304]MDS1140248.1 class III extradiol ring-cleavage dioxygenase [Pusillimonas sp. SM2304]
MAATPNTTTGIEARMPTLFIPHGAGPCFFMDWNPADAWDRTRDFLEGVAATLPERPKAIVLVSGHWLGSAFSVTSNPRPSLIYDYNGFPAHTYELRYPAPGEPQLASRIVELLNQNHMPATENANRGLDHGVFIPLKLMFPDADIPVVQLSLRQDMDPAVHLQAGKALAPLRDEGVLIIGSGMSFHNMRGYGDPQFGPISDQFDHWLADAVSAAPARREQALTDWAQAPGARLSHPPRAEEHLLPLMVAAGAAGAGRGERIFSDRVMEVTLSAFRFTDG